MPTPLVNREEKSENRKKKRNVEDMENVCILEDVDFDFDSETESKSLDYSGTGCGRTICRNCCVDNPQTYVHFC